jgi:hypothetical protein
VASLPGSALVFKLLAEDTSGALSEAVSSLSAAYGLEGGEAEWLPGVIARYGLTPPPGM